MRLGQPRVKRRQARLRREGEQHQRHRERRRARRQHARARGQRVERREERPSAQDAAADDERAGTELRDRQVEQGGLARFLLAVGHHQQERRQRHRLPEQQEAGEARGEQHALHAEDEDRRQRQHGPERVALPLVLGVPRTEPGGHERDRVEQQQEERRQAIDDQRRAEQQRRRAERRRRDLPGEERRLRRPAPRARSRSSRSDAGGASRASGRRRRRAPRAADRSERGQESGRRQASRRHRALRRPSASPWRISAGEGGSPGIRT